METFKQILETGKCSEAEFKAAFEFATGIEYSDDWFDEMFSASAGIEEDVAVNVILGYALIHINENQTLTGSCFVPMAQAWLEDSENN